MGYQSLWQENILWTSIFYFNFEETADWIPAQDMAMWIGSDSTNTNQLKENQKYISGKSRKSTVFLWIFI